MCRSNTEKPELILSSTGSGVGVEAVEKLAVAVRIWGTFFIFFLYIVVSNLSSTAI